MGAKKILIGSALYLYVCAFSLGFGRSIVTPEAKCFINELSRFIGKTELTGRNDGEAVETVLRSAGLNPKSRAPYCGAYMTHGFVACRIKPHGNAWSPSWFPKKRLVSVNEVQDSSFYFFGLFYPKLNRIGHVGYVLRKTATYIITIEGNTSANAAVGSTADRTGNGFHSKKRRMIKGVTYFSRWR
jgi:hypothetical protein